MSANDDDWKRWLNEKENKMLVCSHLLEPPAAEVIEQWAQMLVEERVKLAKARGMLYSVKMGDDTKEELEETLEETKGE